MRLSCFPSRLHLTVGLALIVWFGAARADLMITGSSTILPVVKRVASEFTAKTGIRVRVSGGGSDHGVIAVIQGRADIGMASRVLHEDESRGLFATTIGRDAIAVYANERNPIAGLTQAQVAAIYSGQLKQWRELGLTTVEGRIYPVGKWHGRSTRELFDGFFGLQGREYPEGTHMIGANVASILYVSLDPLGIGYVSVGSLDHAAKQGAPVKILPLDGVAPTHENIQSGRYAYTRPLNLVTRGAPRDEAALFIEWMTGKPGQEAVRAEGFMIRTAP